MAPWLSCCRMRGGAGLWAGIPGGAAAANALLVTWLLVALAFDAALLVCGGLAATAQPGAGGAAHPAGSGGAKRPSSLQILCSSSSDGTRSARRALDCRGGGGGGGGMCSTHEARGCSRRGALAPPGSAARPPPQQRCCAGSLLVRAAQARACRQRGGAVTLAAEGQACRSSRQQAASRVRASCSACECQEPGAPPAAHLEGMQDLQGFQNQVRVCTLRLLLQVQLLLLLLLQQLLQHASMLAAGCRSRPGRVRRLRCRGLRRRRRRPGWCRRLRPAGRLGVGCRRGRMRMRCGVQLGACRQVLLRQRWRCQQRAAAWRRHCRHGCGSQVAMQHVSHLLHYRCMRRRDAGRWLRRRQRRSSRSQLPAVRQGMWRRALGSAACPLDGRQAELAQHGGRARVCGAVGGQRGSRQVAADLQPPAPRVLCTTRWRLCRRVGGALLWAAAGAPAAAAARGGVRSWRARGATVRRDHVATAAALRPLLPLRLQALLLRRAAALLVTVQAAPAAAPAIVKVDCRVEAPALLAEAHQAALDLDRSGLCVLRAYAVLLRRGMAGGGGLQGTLLHGWWVLRGRRPGPAAPGPAVSSRHRRHGSAWWHRRAVGAVTCRAGSGPGLARSSARSQGARSGVRNGAGPGIVWLTAPA